ncbi:MAG: class I tRNA ligase family protein [Mycobacteriales bacterium]
MPSRCLRLDGRSLHVIGRARVYVCGVTPYDVTHLGHAATFVWADAATQLLRHLGSIVEVCRNITDVDDVLFDAAARAGAPYDRFAAVQQFYFERDMEALRVHPPTHQPRARAHIGPVIGLAEAVLASGAGYAAGGGVYVRGAPVAAAAGLDRHTALAQLAAAGGRIDDPAKEDPLDQAVWQASVEGEPSWPSPWGPGRPGWHAECAAMALATFGPALDLHAGGADLAFPHHAYEAALAEAATGVRPFARAWLHAGVVQLAGAKMAKSTQNLVFARDLVERYGAGPVRLLLLDRPWRDPWDYSEEAMAAAALRWEDLHAAAGRAARGPSKVAAETAVEEALLDDLDVPRAVHVALEEGGPAARLLVSVLAL